MAAVNGMVRGAAGVVDPLVVVVALITERAGRQNDQDRTQALAAAGDNVFRDGAHETDIGIQPAPDHGIDGQKVGGKKIA